MSGINAEKVCYVIAKARELESEDEGLEADGSNPADDRFVAVISDAGFDPARAELVGFIDAMDEDEQYELVALSWIGRGQFTREEWASAVAEARGRHERSTAEYLLGNPMLAAHLESGLSEFNEHGEGVGLPLR